VRNKRSGGMQLRGFFNPNSSSMFGLKPIINPVDTSAAPTKKRVIIIKSNSELVQICNIPTDVKLEQLTNSIDVVNPKVKPLSKATSDIFEI